MVYRGETGNNFQKNVVFYSLEVDFVLANSVEPDEMQHYAASLIANVPV